MHQPNPYGLFGHPQGDDDMRVVQQMTRKLTNIKMLGGLDSLRLVRTLPSGALAVAQDMGGMLKVFIKPMGDPEEEKYTEPTSPTFIPMFFSGRITKPLTTDGVPIDLAITKTTRSRLKHYAKDSHGKVMAPESLRLHRFLIKHGKEFMELEGKQSSDVIKTQYANQHPSWYSGAMAEVVQLVAGYGRSDGKLPKAKAAPGEEQSPMREYERLQMVLPAKWLTLLKAERVNTRVPGAKGRPPESGQIQFDYKVNKTHGVGFDKKKNPWLIQVASKGVHVMPLPLVPATTTKTFRRYIEEVGDDEILWALDRFGGLPSGESFPPTANDGFDAWVRAGVIVKVCDASDFYQHLYYSSACGWSFNSNGTEGFNTCYDYDDTEHIGYGLAYKLTLSLGESKDTGKLDNNYHMDWRGEGSVMDAYLSMLYKMMGAENIEKHRALKYKLMRRVAPKDVLRRAEDYYRFLSVGDDGEKAKKEFDYWDKLETDPIAVHSGSINRVARGWLYHKAKFMDQPQIKYPEPFMQGCVSHDFLPLINGRYKSKYPNCDTIMFGYYIGDQLKVVKYFLDERSYKEDVQSNYSECMIVGSWEKVETAEPTSLQGHFYTSDFDARKSAAPTTTTTKIVGTDLGYDSIPFFEFDDFFSTTGSIYRQRYFKHITNTETTKNSLLKVAICIPYLTRNAVLHATTESVTGKTTSESVGLQDVRDPNSYRYYTYDFVYAWVGKDYSGNKGTATLPKVPKDGNPVWVLGYNYDPGQCTDFADQGDWMGGIPQDYTWLIHPNKGEWRHKGGGTPPSVKTYVEQTDEGASESRGLSISILQSTSAVHKSPDTPYFTGSPDPYLGVFYRDAVKNCAGKSVYANVMEHYADAPKMRRRFGHTKMANHESAHFFIGVLNE